MEIALAGQGDDLKRAAEGGGHLQQCVKLRNGLFAFKPSNNGLLNLGSFCQVVLRHPQFVPLFDQ
mgnify:CR=1 FL=1